MSVSPDIRHQAEQLREAALIDAQLEWESASIHTELDEGGALEDWVRYEYGGK